MTKSFSLDDVKDNITRTRNDYGSSEPQKFQAVDGVKQALKKISNSAVIPVDDVEVDPDQPRKTVSDAEFTELVEDVRVHGVHTPITVRNNRSRVGEGKKFIIIFGERRYRAAVAAGLEMIPTLVHQRELTEKELRVLQWSENDKRQGLNRIDEARFLQGMLQEAGSMRALGRELGIGHDRISRTVRLLDLPEYAQDAIASGKLSDEGSEGLLRIKDTDQQRKQFEALMGGNVTAAEVKQSANGKKSGTTKPKTNNTKTIDGLTMTLSALVRFSNKEKAERLRKWAEKLDPQQQTQKAA
jgi:ParB family chromosome partitioning protein